MQLLKTQTVSSGKSAVSPSTRSSKVAARQSHVAQASKGHKGRWAGMDAGNDVSDDQQDIARGRGMVDELFQGWGGTAGTQNAIMSSSDYISTAQRTFNNVEDGFYISPSFLDKLSIHIAKNFMNLPKIKVPLILGIWGGKGQGKTFQCMLAFKKLGITPIVMSAGELESGNAGEPAKLIRQRYREASDMIKKGKMCCLFINDLDAGAGRFGLTTQYTVNNQMVNATLMNIADNPTNVQLPGVYKNEEIPRVPIICTGNDFSTLYAPLIRDGRMEKYYWNPTREDRVGVCMGIFHEDNLTRGEVESMVDAFPGQSIDFFGALRARVYDDKVREFVNEIGHENLQKRLINSREGKVKFEKPKMTIDVLMAYGNSLVREQDNVKRVQLADAYLAGAELAGSDGSSVPETYQGAKNLNLGKNNASSGGAGWRTDGVRAAEKEFKAAQPSRAPAAPAPTPSYSPAPAAPASSGDRWSSYSRGSGSSTPAAAAGGSGQQTLSASDLAKFKIADLAEIARKKGVSGGRDATRQTLTDALLKVGIAMSELTKGQQAELKAGGGASMSIPSAAAPAPSSYSPAPAAPAASTDRFSSYTPSSPRAAAPSGAANATLSAGDLSAFKIVDLVEIAGKKGVSAGRDATRDGLTSALVKAGVSLSDLTRGQLVDLGTKLGKAGLSRDINAARAELASLIGGSGSATASWRATPAPTATPAKSQQPPASWRVTPSSSSSSGDRWASASRGSSTPAAGASAGGKLSASDLSTLRIDDLRDLVKKTGAQLPREPTKDGVISSLISKGVSLNDLTRGMLVDLSTKLGAPLAKDAEGLRRNLASLVGGGSSSGSSASWRSTPAAAAAPAASTGDRWSTYSAGSTKAASWRRSGSHNASGSKLGSGDLAALRIDDLRDLVKKTGAQLPREPTKDGVISSLISKGVSLNDLTRGMLVDLSNKLGAPIAKDVDGMRKNLAARVGKGSYSAAPAASTSSWRTETPAAAASSSGDRWASYSRSSSNGAASAAGGSNAIYEADLSGFKIDMLSEMARKKGISMRNATKDSLVQQLAKTMTLADLSRGQLIEVLHNIGQSTSGSVDQLRSRVAAAASQRQSARSTAGSRW